MRIHALRLSTASLSLFALMLAGCAPAESSSYSAGILRSACGSAGGGAVDLVLTQAELACSTPSVDLPATRLSVNAFGTVSALDAVEVERAYLAERCTDGACSAITGGTLETLRTEGDRAEVRWSLELADGSLDEGTAWIRVCAGSTGCL